MTNFQEMPNMLYNETISTLNNGESLDTGWFDLGSVDKIQVSGQASVSGMTFEQESRAKENGDILSNSLVYSDGNFFLINITSRQRFGRFKRTNNTGSAVTGVSFEVKATYGSSDKLSVLPLGVQPTTFSQAALVQSVSIGQDPTGVFRSVQVNEAGATLGSDFGTEVSRGLYSNYQIITKFGRNPDIDTGSAPEDMWNGSVSYTGFPDTGDNITVVSSDNDDRGSLVSSGTATGGSNTTLIDSSATFISDGVVVGDAVLNDTQGMHGYISSVDSETQLTIQYGMLNGPGQMLENISGDTYRIARSIDTGAAVLRLSNPLDSNFDAIVPKYVILNGTTPVVVTGDFRRLSTCRVVLAGSTGRNEGEFTIAQQSTPANVFCVVPTFGSTTIGCWTIPKDKVCLIKRLRASIVRNNGSPGSATISLNVKPIGGAFTAERVFEVNTGAAVEEYEEGALYFEGPIDLKRTIEQVSDNNTIADASAEYYLVDRT